MSRSTSKRPVAVEKGVRRFLSPYQLQRPVNEGSQRTNLLISVPSQDPNPTREGIPQVEDIIS